MAEAVVALITQVQAATATGHHLALMYQQVAATELIDRTSIQVVLAV